MIFFSSSYLCLIQNIELYNHDLYWDELYKSWDYVPLLSKNRSYYDNKQLQNISYILDNNINMYNYVD